MLVQRNRSQLRYSNSGRTHMWASRPEVPVGGDLVGLRRQAAGELPGAYPTQPDESARGPDAGRRGLGGLVNKLGSLTAMFQLHGKTKNR